MIVAGLLVMGVAAINLALLRLAGTLWDVITVQHDRERMTELIGLFIGLMFGGQTLHELRAAMAQQ